MSGVSKVHPVSRFWSKVDVRGPDECWPWIAASRMSGGYGVMTLSSNGAKRQHGAHRLAYQWYVGPIPEGMLVCHRCDNPPCVNPAHLFVGTYADNNRDKTEKGRNPGNRTNRGRKQHALRGADLVAAESLIAQGWTQRRVAAHFGISPAAVCRALKTAA